jgi:hypothetical protein
MRLPIETRPLADIEADWPRLSGLLDEIMNLPPASRETFIGALPPPDDRLADTLRELLALQAKVETEDFMDDLPVFPGVTDLGAADAAGAAAGRAAGAGGLVEGAEVGPYRLLRAIGEGGMGAVWLAERADGTLKRKVALKLPRLAWAQDLAVRMARERDILAGLEHPNIARLYDAGLDAQGRPWLALEFVEGRDLTTYCDAERLDLRARVRLFMQVLDAVQYAHASLVIHRDIKPANILVTPRGEARLLDFGIARLEEGAAEAGPDLTRTGVSAMTPRYASPEQVQGARLTVASDIYSLGVVLHELLTGETPYVLRRASRAELEQAILDADLRVPSRLKAGAEAAAARATTPERIARDLRGDLDAVLLRALARTPAARYASAAAFRDDLERWLGGRPVDALPPSRLHTLRKFVARNRLAVAASAAAALALVAVSVVAVVQAQRATRSAAEAREQAARSESTKDTILAVIRDADATREKNPQMSVREIVAAQLEVRLVDQPGLRTELLDRLTEVYSEEGDLAGAGSAYSRMAKAALDKGDVVGAVDALIQAGYYAVSRRDVDGALRSIERIRGLVAPSDLKPGVRAALHDLEGHRLGLMGDRTGASREFSSKIVAAREARDDVGVFAGLVDRMRVDGGSDDGADRVRQIVEIRDALTRLPGPAQAENRLLLASMLMSIGAYREGWTDMLRFMATEGARFGDTGYLSRQAHALWLRYCVRVDRADLARQWLRDLERPELSHVLRGLERDPAWRLRVAEVLAADRDWGGAQRQLRSARALLDSPAGRMSSTERRLSDELALAEASLVIGEGLTQRSAAQIEALRTTLSDPSDEASGDRYRWARLRGLMELGLGQAEGAVEDLTEASRRARAELGPSHPELARVDIALAIARSRVAPEVPDRGSAALLRRADAVLRAALPSPHAMLEYLDGLGGPVDSDADAIQMATRSASRPLPDVFIP